MSSEHMHIIIQL